MKSSQIGYVQRCQICRNKKLDPVLRYGNLPIVQAYLAPKDLRNPETTYPLNLVYCSKCSLLQLDYIPDPKIVFPKNYPYRTGLTNMLIRNFQKLAETVTTTYKLSKNDLIVDIGSNDGSLLQQFKIKGMRVIGIEPTDAAKDANKNGIATYQEFFNKTLVQNITKKHGHANIVTATNVFAHINNVGRLAHGIKELLAPNGIFISESQYFLDTFKKLEFDCIYHEHIRFYTLKPLITLLRNNGMSVIDAERISAAGGSIRVFAKKGKHKTNKRVKQILAEEKKLGLYNIKRLRTFGDRARAAKRDVLRLLAECKKNDNKIAGIGSPARGNTLLGFTHIDKDFLEYVCEKAGSPKIGLLTPGTHIPVVTEERLLKDQPPYALVVSWHIGEELINIMRKKGYKGKFIMPLPKPRII